MTIEEIDREILKYDTAKAIRKLLDDARAKCEAAGGDAEEFESECLDLVTSE